MSDIERMAREAIGPDEILALCELVRAQERERCAKVASMYVIEKRELHPDVPFESVSEGAKGIAHSTCQYVAAAIRST